ncbi:hypothetical protein HH212_23220 [Massilia forsythiae]|uniref:Tle cognate immunity protein 4 C-terminal domain-containing protein n=2 Tax=Massilia forsythiae TaxID=2728020 RepID=A0A7Z2W0A5_9BURK|nr:hypothetical protein HH212_23220 [Massilia forsythiae]
MKTVCVGRFLVDVPVQAEVSLSREMIDGFEIEKREESETAFHERVAARAADIDAQAAKDPARRTSGMLEARDLAIPGMAGRSLVYGRTRSYYFEGERRIDTEWVSVEVHAHKEGWSFSLSAKFADETSARAAEALLARLRLRGEDDIPAVAGFCIGRAVFAEPLPPHKTEHIAMHIGLPDHPDLGMAFASLPGGGTSRTLLERYADMDADAGADELLRVTRLRTGKRDIDALAGEEVLERVREFNFATTFGFVWEAQGVKDDPLRPFLSLELHAGISAEPGGKPRDSSLHEDAVLALWDCISSSIRLRPGGPPPSGPSGPAEPPGPKLGAVASAGDTCPQSGWWQCNEGGPDVGVQGGQVQYIRKGERMPQPLLLPRQTLWQKVRRIQSSVEPERLAAWKLVDKRLWPRMVPLVALAQPGMPPMPGDAGAGKPPVALLGTQVRTGEPCPASGWWRCEESHALDGTRWFAHGSLLPAATFQVPASVFGHAAGPEAIRRRSVWQLVRQMEPAPPRETAPADVAAAGILGEPPALA